MESGQKEASDKFPLKANYGIGHECDWNA
jgi:hypothetical protein